MQWLAPVEYDTDYYKDDLRIARRLRHAGTCQWILSTPQFSKWFNSVAPSENSFLWIYAIPGAGKTVLTSFLIDSQSSTSRDAPLLVYFFFKNTDADKNTPTASARSLLYQLYKHIGPNYDDLVNNLHEVIDNSGQAKSKSFNVLWDLIVKFARCVPYLVIILDALDECNEARHLLRRLLKLSKEASVKIFCTSRREKEQFEELQTVPSFEMGPEEVSKDIHAFLEYKVSKSPKLSHPLVRSSIIEKLKIHSRGMFLWVALMIKELKSKGSVTEIRDCLESLPDGLDKVYEGILTRLQTTLRSSSKTFCYKMLKWIVCATRPLNLQEIREAIKVDYSGDQFSSSEEILFYSERDFELACGSLLAVRNCTIQLIHLSVKEYLQKSETDPELPAALHKFFVDPIKSNNSLAGNCTSYLLRHCSQQDSMLQDGRRERRYDLTKLNAQLPLLEYASFNWLIHATDGLSDVVLPSNSLMSFIHSPASLTWIHYCFASDSNCLVRLRFNLKEFLAQIMNETSSCTEQSTPFDLIQRWLRSCLQLLQEYGQVLTDRPFEVHLIHPENIFGAQEFPFSRYLASTTKYIKLVELRTFSQGTRSGMLPDSHYLEENTGLRLSLGFFEFDSERDCFFYLNRDNAYIYCQERSTGRKLNPIADPELEDEANISLLGAKLSSDRKYLGTVYYLLTDGPLETLHTTVWLLQSRLDFQSGRRSTTWGRIIISETIRAKEFSYSQCAIALADGVVYCPSGQFDLRTGDQMDHPKTFIQQDDDADPLDSLTFSGDGSSVVGIRSRRIHKFGSAGAHLGSFSTSKDKIYFLILSFSYTGRYLLWYEYQSKPTCILQDTISGQRYILELVSAQSRDMTFVFSADESRLIGMHSFSDALEVPITDIYVWTLASSPVLSGTRRLRQQILGSFLHAETDTLFIVVQDRIWRNLSLSDLTFLDLDGKEHGIDSGWVVHEVSKDGRRLASLWLRENGYVFRIYLSLSAC